MCIFCGDMSDPFHGLGPAPLMLGTIFAGRAWRQTIRPALVRTGHLKPTVDADPKPEVEAPAENSVRERPFLGANPIVPPRVCAIVADVLRARGHDAGEGGSSGHGGGGGRWLVSYADF